MKRRSEHLVRKRDGRTEFLRATKLARSIHQALQSVGIDEDWRALELANVVLTALQQRGRAAGAKTAGAKIAGAKIAGGDARAAAVAMLTTEAIADAVQHVLVATGQPHAAVAYGAKAAERARRHRAFAALGRTEVLTADSVSVRRVPSRVASDRLGPDRLGPDRQGSDQLGQE
ncbi:MAG: hypothetical protein U1E73_08520 [Planctomycetota bacterium]